MSATNKDPSKAVKEILRKRNVEIMDYIANHLVTFAACLRKHGLITNDTQRSIGVAGTDPAQLAQKLMSACDPSLTQFPKKKFPKFITVMKEFEDMLELAEEMEADYKRATGLQLFESSPEHSEEGATGSGPTTDLPKDAQLQRPQLQTKKVVPFSVKRKFDLLQTRFGAIFLRAFMMIEQEDLTALKKYLSAAFRDTRHQVSNLESKDQLENFLLDHSSFIDFPMLEGLAKHFNLEEVEKELTSFIDYRNKMYGQILAEDFELAGINQCVQDSQTEILFEVRWVKNKATLLQFEEMLAQAFDNARKFIHLKAVHSSLLTFICAAWNSAVGSLIQVARERVSVLRELGVVKLTIGQEVILHDKEEEVKAVKASEDTTKQKKGAPQLTQQNIQHNKVCIQGNAKVHGPVAETLNFGSVTMSFGGEGEKK